MIRCRDYISWLAWKCLTNNPEEEHTEGEGGGHYTAAVTQTENMQKNPGEMNGWMARYLRELPILPNDKVPSWKQEEIFITGNKTVTSFRLFSGLLDWLLSRALHSRTRSAEVLKPKCETSLHVKTPAHLSSAGGKQSLWERRDPDKAAFKSVAGLLSLYKHKNFTNPASERELDKVPLST